MWHNVVKIGSPVSPLERCSSSPQSVTPLPLTSSPGFCFRSPISLCYLGFNFFLLFIFIWVLHSFSYFFLLSGFYFHFLSHISLQLFAYCILVGFTFTFFILFLLFLFVTWNLLLFSCFFTIVSILFFCNFWVSGIVGESFILVYLGFLGLSLSWSLSFSPAPKFSHFFLF